MNRLVTLIAAALLAPQTCWADPFCDGLKKIAADAPADFAATRGEPDADRPTHFSTPFTLSDTYRFLPAVPPCEVERGDGARMVYSCYFPASAFDLEAKEQVGNFTGRVAACLGAVVPGFDFTAPHEQNPFATSNRGPFRMSANGVDVETGIFFPPDGGGGTLYFNVSAHKAEP